MRPYVLVSCALSLDGRLDDATPRRLMLSGLQDLARVDASRSECDAVLVGAGTVRADDPRLMVRDPARQPQRVVLSGTGQLDPGSRLFSVAPQEPPVVYVGTSAFPATEALLGSKALVRDAGAPPSLVAVLSDLADRGLRRVMIEGGASVIDEALREDVVDELHLHLAPFLLGDPGTPRFGTAGPFPQGPARPLRLAGAEPIDDGGVVLRYLVEGRP